MRHNPPPGPNANLLKPVVPCPLPLPGPSPLPPSAPGETTRVHLANAFCEQVFGDYEAEDDYREGRLPEVGC